MLVDFRKTALITAIVLVLAQVHGVYVTVTGNTSFPWYLIVQFVIGVSLAVPLPVLLFLLYKTDTIPAVNGKLSSLAIAILLVDCACFVADNLYFLSRINRVPYLGFGLSLLPGIVYIVFLASLSQQQQGRPADDERHAWLIWDVTRVTLLAIWASVAMGVVRFGVFTVKYESSLAAFHLAGDSARWIYYLRHIGGILSLFCSAIAAWILYKGLSIANASLLESSESTAGTESAGTPESGTTD